MTNEKIQLFINSPDPKMQLLAISEITKINPDIAIFLEKLEDDSHTAIELLKTSEWYQNVRMLNMLIKNSVYSNIPFYSVLSSIEFCFKSIDLLDNTDLNLLVNFCNFLYKHDFKFN